VPTAWKIEYYSRNPGSGRTIEKAEHDGMHAVINCRQLIDFCVDYIDGSLPEDEQLRFRRHLSQCPDCVVFFETYQKTPELTREALSTQMPASVRESVHSFLRAQRGS
jgi:anti-sigma factor RsiW